MSEAPSTRALTSDERSALAQLLDVIIPPSDDGRLPGAGELGIGDVLEEQVPDLRPVLAQGVAALDALARDRGAGEFAALDAEARVAALNELATRDPGFLPGLIFHTYGRYYQDGRVLAGLGMEPRPPHPEGYPLESGDLSLLENVRRRGRLYREV